MGGDKHATEEFRWLTSKMLELAATADNAGAWGFVKAPLVPTDEMTYDRFGPTYSDVKFDWHCDDGEHGPRDISVVAYFTEPELYEGGTLEIEMPNSSFFADV